jgi:hypothetical protein
MYEYYGISGLIYWAWIYTALQDNQIGMVQMWSGTNSTLYEDE